MVGWWILFLITDLAGKREIHFAQVREPWVLGPQCSKCLANTVYGILTSSDRESGFQCNSSEGNLGREPLGPGLGQEVG